MRLSAHALLAPLLAAGPGALAGGCLPAPGALLPPAPRPGSYWVARHSGRLCYFQLPPAAGQPGQWLPLADDGAWFAGPGFYRLAADLTWSADEDFAGRTLDEVLQLHDPGPAVPERGRTR